MKPNLPAITSRLPTYPLSAQADILDLVEDVKRLRACIEDEQLSVASLEHTTLELREAMERVTNDLSAFADFYPGCFMHVDANKAFKTGTSVEFINAVDADIRLARAALKETP